jgi:hypothetical protein
MTHRLVQSCSGHPTILAGDIYLHSRYDPKAEASRFVQSLEFSNSCDFFLILEPGLGYCIPELKKAYPKTRMLVLHASRDFKDIPETHDSQAHGIWYPDLGIDVIHFLENEIPEGSLCQLIEWKPSIGAYGQTYQSIRTEIKQFLEREAANIRTTAGFGKRWLKNVFKNLALLQNPLYFERGQIPVLVTGAGPSLEDAIPLIHRALQQGPLCIVAASSSVPALLAHQIVPSISVATDGGTWAAFHLIDQFRRAVPLVANKPSPLPFPLAVTLNAKLCSQAAQVPQLLISDGSLWQARLLQKLSIPFIQLPQRGTVSATILDVAMLISTGPVYITGMDMAHRDIQTHARPYGLDFYIDERACRFTPLYSLACKRSLMDANHGALSIYAAWFDRYFQEHRERISVLGTRQHPKFPMLPVSQEIHWDSYKEPSFYILPRKNDRVHQYIQEYVALLIDELQTTAEQKQMQEELSYLLSGRKQALAVPEIIKGLRDLFY